jgi:antitoxin component of RelBE/YafQ-DinJ toxin-antitoxin module
MTTWPATLPQCPILNDFSEQRQRNLAAFEPDVGPPKMRRRSTAVAVSTAVAFRMDLTELAAFNTFFETTLKDGTLPFDWAHPLTQTTYSWMFDAKEAPRIDRMTPSTVRVTFNLLRLPA